MQDTGFDLLRLSPVTRFTDAAIMSQEVLALEKDGYRCVPLDCSLWTSEDDFHTVIASSLEFPGWYGRNLNAFNDCLVSMKWQGFRGLVLVFSHWNAFSRAVPDWWWHVLDIIASASRIRLVYGDRLLALIQTSESDLPIKPFGKVGAVPSQRESSLRAREILAKLRQTKPE